MVVGTNIHFCIIFFPYLVLIIWLLSRNYHVFVKNKTYQFIALALLSLVEVALVIWALLMGGANSFQLVMLNILPLLGCTLTFFLIQGIMVHGQPQRWVYIMLVGLLSYNMYRIYLVNRNNSNEDTIPYTDTYLQTIDQAVQRKVVGKVGGFLLHPKDYNTEYTKSPAYEQVGVYLGFMMNEFANYSLSDLEIPEAPALLAKEEPGNALETAIMMSPFFRFVQQQQRQKNFVSIDQSKIEFMKKHHFSFLIANKDVDITPFNALIDSVITDSKSGERFVILNCAK